MASRKSDIATRHTVTALVAGRRQALHVVPETVEGWETLVARRARQARDAGHSGVQVVTTTPLVGSHPVVLDFS